MACPLTRWSPWSWRWSPWAEASGHAATPQFRRTRYWRAPPAARCTPRRSLRRSTSGSPTSWSGSAPGSKTEDGAPQQEPASLCVSRRQQRQMPRTPFSFLRTQTAWTSRQWCATASCWPCRLRPPVSCARDQRGAWWWRKRAWAREGHLEARSRCSLRSGTGRRGTADDAGTARHC